MTGEFQDTNRPGSSGQDSQSGDQARTGRQTEDQGPERLGERIKEAAEHLKDEAASGARAAKDSARSFVSEKQGSVAAEVGKVSGAIRAAADNLSAEGGNSTLTGLVRDAADGINGLASSIENKSPEEMVRLATEFARRQPALFFAGAALMGVVAGRFIRASAAHVADRSSDQYPEAV